MSVAIGMRPNPTRKCIRDFGSFVADMTVKIFLASQGSNNAILTLVSDIHNRSSPGSFFDFVNVHVLDFVLGFVVTGFIDAFPLQTFATARTTSSGRRVFGGGDAARSSSSGLAGLAHTTWLGL